MNTSSLKFFFTYETGIPDGIGFGLFKPWHLLWLMVCVFLTAVFLFYYAKAGADKRKTAEKILVYSMPGWMMLRILYIIVIKEQLIYELPLHLCSLSGLLCMLHYFTGWKWIGQVLYTVGLPGTVVALVFPNWTFYPAIHFITIEGFFFHMGIVMYVCAMLYVRKIVPDIKKIWSVVLFLLAVVTPVYFFDKKFNTNYMFVNWPSQGSPLEFIAAFMGNPGYLLGYAVLVLFCILLMNAVYQIIRRLFL